MKNLAIILIFVIQSIYTYGQKIDNMASFRDINSDSYFRFNFDNDYFTSSDKDYTGGYSFELVSPILKRNPANYLLLKPSGKHIKYGIAFEQIVFTPECIKSFDVQFGDRPYATAAMLKSFAVAIDTVAKSRLTSSINIGWLGPGACGKEMQTGIHDAINYTIPRGWCYQIKNDLVLNYELSYEKQLLRYRNLLSIQANSSVKLGTLYTNGGIGFSTTIGLINSPFSPNHSKKGFCLYLYSQPLVNIIGYDATLQGGIFNRDSPYTIAAGSLKRFTAQHNYGIVLQTKSLYFEYSRTAITKEFDSGRSSKWGGIKFGVKI